MERAIRIARQHGLPANLPRWTMVRDPIYGQIMERGWHDGRRAFVQHDDTDVLDASLLLVPLSNFIAPSDPRWISTPDAIADELVSDSLGPETAALLERESRSPAIALVVSGLDAGDRFGDGAIAPVVRVERSLPDESDREVARRVATPLSPKESQAIAEHLDGSDSPFDGRRRTTGAAQPSRRALLDLSDTGSAQR